MALNLKISNIRTISQYEFEKPDCFGKIDSYESISKKDFENISGQVEPRSSMGDHLRQGDVRGTPRCE